MKNDLIIGMVGSGGDGVVSAGEALMTAARRRMRAEGDARLDGRL